MAPVTTATVTGTGTGYDGWYQSVSIRLAATDDKYNIKLTEFSLVMDPIHVPGSWNTYTGAIDIANDGIWYLYYRSTNDAPVPETEDPKMTTLKIDTTPPMVVFDVPDAGFTKEDNIITNYYLNQPLIADYEVYDGTTFVNPKPNSGLNVATIKATVPNGQAVYTGSVGLKPFFVSADDNAGNHAEYDRQYRVIYLFKFPGNIPWHFPIIDQQLLLKFQLTDYHNNYIEGAKASLFIASIPHGLAGEHFIPAAWNDSRIKGNPFQYDQGKHEYFFQADLKTTVPGKYRMKIVLDDGTEHISDFTIPEKIEPIKPLQPI